MSTTQAVQDYINKCYGDPRCYSREAREDARQAVQDEIDAGNTSWRKVEQDLNDVLCLVSQSDTGWGHPVTGAVAWGVLLVATTIGCVSGIVYAYLKLIHPLVVGVVP